MWIYGDGDNGKEMEDISHCFFNFPHFRKDFNILIDEGVIKHVAFDEYKWTKSKTSLAEYFKWADGDVEYVTSGFWAPIETTFRIKRGTLRKLAGNNANPLKPDKSKDFIKIQKIVEDRRKEIERLETEWAAYTAIKELMASVDEDDPEKYKKFCEKSKRFWPELEPVRSFV
ncbi:hypothetical protein FACS1894190_09080 [Spirochaetia bacterium]|nr:hypothetical protein FACS1894190_09080 [Spirochaetia bacterium]